LVVEQISGVTPTDAPTQAHQNGQPPDGALAAPQQSGFGSRGRARRRARFLRKARELAYRDLGGLVFNLHRFGARNDELVLAKLTTVGHVDAELRTLEEALGERETVTVLREAGINACPRCAAIHSSEDRFCPNCGLSMGRHADLPIAGAPAPGATPAAPAPTAPAAATVAPPTSPSPSAPAAAPTPPPASAPAASPPAPSASTMPTPAATAPPASPTVAPAAARRPSFTSTTPPSAPDAPAEPAPTPPRTSDSEQPTEIIHPEPPGP
jgi:hypothetical protein